MNLHHSPSNFGPGTTPRQKNITRNERKENGLWNAIKTKANKMLQRHNPTEQIKSLEPINKANDLNIKNRTRLIESTENSIFNKEAKEPMGRLVESSDSQGKRKLTIPGIDNHELNKIILNLQINTKKEDQPYLANFLSSLNISTMDVFKAAILAAMLMTASESIEAKDNLIDKIRSGDITADLNKAFETVRTLSEFDYTIYLTEQRYPASPNQKFESFDANILAWNIYHEARGEPKEGQLAVMLATLNRMESKNFPQSVGGVVFQKFAYSWTLAKQKLSTIVENTSTQEINGVKQIVVEKVTQTSFEKIKDMVDSFINPNMSLAAAQQAITNALKIELSKKQKVSEQALKNVTTYHKMGMLGMRAYSQGIKTADTFRRIAYLESLLDANDPRLVKIGTHAFYPDLSPEVGWVLPEKYEKFISNTNMSEAEKGYAKSGKPSRNK